MTLAEFEGLVLTQQPASTAWQPVTDYSFKARQAAEGDLPRLILDVFQPTRLIDVGCGFNYLATLINMEAGRRIAIGADVIAFRADVDHAMADMHLDITVSSGMGGYDVVVCREVLEHLTLRQIRRAITNLCQTASRFVYLTTRFHPNPASLLDVATSDNLDPTHISMCNKDFIRMLFVLEGFKRRADLEERMDHQHKSRVLVYERT